MSNSGAAGSVSATAADKKRRKTSIHQCHTAADNLLTSASDKSRTYIVHSLQGEENDELASLIADMLRDGDLNKALDRKRMSGKMRALGPLLPVNKKGQTTWKMLGRRFDRELVELLVGKSLFGKDESSLKLISGQRYNQLVCFAMHQHPDTEIPCSHSHAQHENPLKAVCLLRYEAMGKRLVGLTKHTIQQLGHFLWKASSPLQLSTPVLGVAVKIPMTMAEYGEADDWKVQDSWNLKTSMFVSEKAGRVQRVLPLLTKQHQQLNIVDEGLSFEYAKAADHFNVVTTSPDFVNPEAASPSKASPDELAAAGVLPIAVFVPPPLS
jgi:hypothetical protein